MNTRYTPLVKLKKNKLQESERIVQRASVDLNSASSALEASYASLGDVSIPESGSVSEMIASRVLLESQRSLIKHNQEWVEFAKNQLFEAKEQLKADMIEYEKFKYLEFQEIKKVMQKQKQKESKELDEIALISFGTKTSKKEDI